MSPAAPRRDVSSRTAASPDTSAAVTASQPGRGSASEVHSDLFHDLAGDTMRARLRRELADLDYVRALHRWAATGTSQRDIARRLGMSQPAVSKHLTRSAETAQPLAGFSGATPLELCKRYVAGWLTREDLISQLAVFPWTPMPALTGWEDPLILPPGTVHELSDARGLGYIDSGIYAEVHARHQAQHAGLESAAGPSSPSDSDTSSRP